MKLTQRRIRASVPRGKKDILVFDDEQRGLGVRVMLGADGSLEGKSISPNTPSQEPKRRIPLAHAAQSRSPWRARRRRPSWAMSPRDATRRPSVRRRARGQARSPDAGDLIEQWAGFICRKRAICGRRRERPSPGLRQLLRSPPPNLDRQPRFAPSTASPRTAKCDGGRDRPYGSALFGWANTAREAYPSIPSRACRRPGMRRDRVSRRRNSSDLEPDRGTGSLQRDRACAFVTGQRREEVAGTDMGRD